MRIAYTDLNTYCESLKLTYREFGRKVFPRREYSWQHLYSVITGGGKPGKKCQRHLDRFIDDHREEIEASLGYNPLNPPDDTDRRIDMRQGT